MQIRIDDIHVNNLRVVGAGNNWNQHERAIELMAEGIIDLSPMVSERIRLEDYETGIQHVRSRPAGFVKAIYVYD
jgi:threonine dehydrogenase-like Zn-dependent dehydrogenase